MKMKTNKTSMFVENDIRVFRHFIEVNVHNGHIKRSEIAQ